MLSNTLILVCSFGYVGLLFAIAYYADKRADTGRGLVAASPYFFALSLAVYCTSWTFYGSVGRAAETGVGFLPVYLGPTITCLMGWFVVRKIVRISKSNRITSIADFISSRYGKSHRLGGLVTIIAVVGIMPYISIQLKAVSHSFTILTHYPDPTLPTVEAGSVLTDTGFYVALLMTAFSILFGTRHLDATEHHEGMVVAIAFESLIKLLAFLTVGFFVTFGLFGGPADLFERAMAIPDFRHLFTFEASGGVVPWITVTLLSMAAVVVLPRQFQVLVVENVDERHLNRALWLLPLYLLVMNIFVLPVAFGGLLTFPNGEVNGDYLLLGLPMVAGSKVVSLIVFIGGLSAATGMVIVASVALSTMVCNDLVIPLLLRGQSLNRAAANTDMPKLLLGIRRLAIAGIMALGYGYFRLIGESYALVTVGLVSFVAAAQFAPSIIGGIYWKNGTRRGAFAGLLGGFLVWIYTLMLPSFAQSGWLPLSFIEQGPLGIELLKPYALFGLDGLDRISHALFWTMLVNVGLYVTLSLFGDQSSIERIQATLFVEAFKREADRTAPAAWRGTTRVATLTDLASRFVGRAKAEKALLSFAQPRSIRLSPTDMAPPDLVQFTERLLAGAVGAASARVAVASVVKSEDVSFEEMINILDEASAVIEYSRRLEYKSRQLEQTKSDLETANLRLRELDQLKDDFLSTVTHELRTPLTSIRSISEILYADPEIEEGQRTQFLGIIVKESDRLTRLINQVLDFGKLESGRREWRMETFDPVPVVRDAAEGLQSMVRERAGRLVLNLPDSLPPIHAEKDGLTQVVYNMVGNAARFMASDNGTVLVSMVREGDGLKLSVIDNGEGIPTDSLEKIFEKFQQVRDGKTGNTGGTGLGLAITQRIVEEFGGRIWAESPPGEGALFHVTLPLAPANETAADNAKA
ncbi:MAG: ATP-binding protein [Rhodospirillales bacterium]